MELRKHKGETRALRIDFGDAGDLNITWRPAGLTPAHARRFTGADAPVLALQMAEILAGVVVDWDLVDDGVPVPVSVAALEELPVDLLAQILASMKDEATVGKASGEPSDAG